MVDLESMSTRVPGVASGVALKSKLLLMYSWYDRLGFTLELRKRFRVITACGMRQSHSDVGNLGLVLGKLDKNNCSKFS